MKYVFIINPTSGNGDKSSLIKKISSYCINNNIDYAIEITKHREDGKYLALKYKHSKSIIFACGGDGTLNEVLNGIVGTKNKLGLIPCGSGNDFYKTIDTYKDKELPIDIAKVNDRYFINVFSIGIDAEVGLYASKLKSKGVNPKKIYNKAIFKTFINFRKKLMEIEVKNNVKMDKFMMLSVCNGRYYGGGYYIAPDASLSDGLLDLYSVSKISKLAVPPLINLLKKGEHEKSKFVEHLMVTKLKIKSKNDLRCCIDGEEYIAKKLVFKVIKKGVVFYQDKELVKYVLG